MTYTGKEAIWSHLSEYVFKWQKPTKIIHLNRETLKFQEDQRNSDWSNNQGKPACTLHFWPKFWRASSCISHGPRVINPGTQMWGFYKGSGWGKRKILQAGMQELMGSVLALPLAVWPQASPCPSLGLSPLRSAVLKLGGRALESWRGTQQPYSPGNCRERVGVPIVPWGGLHMLSSLADIYWLLAICQALF